MPEIKNKEKCPVCGMDVKKDTEIKTEYKGETYYFCSESDKKIFLGNPEKYRSWAA